MKSPAKSPSKKTKLDNEEETKTPRKGKLGGVRSPKGPETPKSSKNKVENIDSFKTFSKSKISKG